MSYFYICDRKSREEAWGYGEYSEKNTAGRILGKYPLGTLFSDFISIDLNSVLSNIEYDENQVTDINFCDYISHEMFSGISEIDHVLLECLEYGIEFREYINICMENESLFCITGFERFCEVIDAYDFDVEQEYSRLDAIPPKGSIFSYDDISDLVETDDLFQMDEYCLDPDKIILRVRRGMEKESFIEKAKKLNYIEVFSSNFPTGLLLQSLKILVLENLKVKKCKSCGKYFVPTKRSDSVYCDRISPFSKGKTCKEFGPKQAWLNVLKEDESASLYRKIYMSKQMRAKRSPDSIIILKDFEQFKKNSKEKKQLVKRGLLSTDAYIDWLKSIYYKK